MKTKQIGKKKWYLLAVALILLLALSLLMLLHSYQQDDRISSGGMVLDTNAIDYSPSSLVVDDDPGIAIPGYGTLYFPAGEKKVPLTLYNPEKNTCLFRFEISLEGENDLLASTGLIEPGKAVQEITLSEALNPGTYTLKIRVLPYETETLTPLNNALVRADLVVYE